VSDRQVMRHLWERGILRSSTDADTDSDTDTDAHADADANTDADTDTDADAATHRPPVQQRRAMRRAARLCERGLLFDYDVPVRAIL